MHEDDHDTHDWTVEADQEQEAHHSLERAVEAVLTAAPLMPGLRETRLGQPIIELKYMYRFWRHHKARLDQALDRWLAQGKQKPAPCRRVGRLRGSPPPKMTDAQIEAEFNRLFSDMGGGQPRLRKCYRCLRCGHIWLARGNRRPVRCPARSCRSAWWQIPLPPGMLHCVHCGFEWQPLQPDVQYCVRCQRPWAMPRKVEYE